MDMCTILRVEKSGARGAATDVEISGMFSQSTIGLSLSVSQARRFVTGNEATWSSLLPDSGIDRAASVSSQRFQEALFQGRHPVVKVANRLGARVDPIVFENFYDAGSKLGRMAERPGAQRSPWRPLTSPRQKEDGEPAAGRA